MGQADRFAKQTFAEETERVTHGAVVWVDPPEIRLEKVKQELIQGARLEEARSALHNVLAGRQLPPSADESAQIDTCTDLRTLQRWLKQSIVANSTSEALR
ncbi:hypothetical protein [Chondromyces apiculatus]|uniref:Uncharacterized protein n=1 Tax=Chondromyces apiculatus DSM 436 TaxID=1192034 RepID=A0A017TEP5_9BACT|nr:hypothetical protein [Chondromyces apiculatus]EYF07392.1 Hypothetical protein CAP_0145 [Chondromyces apiculatus DSM 436]